MSKVSEVLCQAQNSVNAALKMHEYYGGKLQVVPRCPVRGLEDFAIWYTPGVAEVCKAIQRERDLSYRYTWRWNVVAVVSDGTRVLGLGDIGPEAALPVMEGKAFLYKYLGGVDAVPIVLNTRDPEEIINTVKLLEPSFGGINLEDIAQPKCFPILERLRKEMNIPVWHDDQQGTAAVILAALINALKLVEKELKVARIVLLGAGAASIATARLLMAAGAEPGNLILVDTKGILHRGRTELKEAYPEKWEMCEVTNAENRRGGLPEALKGADAIIALSKPEPGTIKPEWIKTMNRDPIVFACANPTPEIWPWEAKEAGAKVVATGRSDFPNQVNNSLVFPAIFRGALDVQATTITDGMCIAAAEALAQYNEKCGRLSPDYILPTMEDWEVYPLVAAATGAKAIAEGVARYPAAFEELHRKATELISASRQILKTLMKANHIKAWPVASGPAERP